jgi:DNA-binding NtrC family response regulator
LLSLDVPALPPDLLERELFRRDDSGLGESATLASTLAAPEGSTLSLRDVFDLPRDLQGRLALALNGKVRLIASTTLDPRAARASEQAQSDLYYLLTSLVIEVDPLRSRLDELPVLAQHFLERANGRGRRQRSGFSPEALRVLLGYDWPGNLRELARVVDEAQALGHADLIAAEDLPATIRGSLASSYAPPPMPSTVTPLDEILTQVERRLIENALAKARRNKSKAAELLGISRPRLYRRIKELGLPEEPDANDEIPVDVDGRA